MTAIRFRAAAALALTTALIGCATHRLPAPIAIAPPAPARPVPPAIVGAGFMTPPRAADGSYITVNRSLTSAETVWHVRAALNVAALGCRGPQEAGTIAAYNALLSNQKTALAAAYKAVQAEHKARWGKTWQTDHDRRMTRVYNFFSQTQAHDAFCAAASNALAQATTIAPGAMASFAAATLPQLESPFTGFYQAWDGYRVELAAWESRYGPNADPALRMAAPAPAPEPQVASWAPPAAAVAPRAAPKLTYAPIDEIFAWQKPVVLASNGARTIRSAR